MLATLYLVVLSAISTIEGSHREHKVHNIVLYPDKHSWCKTLPIKQVISYPGCKSEEIDNNVCVGTCFSYSIPHTEPSDPGEVIVPYCDSCQPSDTTWHHVTLECAKDPHETPIQMVKRIQLIHNCSCSSCEKNRGGSGPRPGEYVVNDDDDDSQMLHNDVPDLLNVLQTRNETNSIQNDEHAAENMKALMNHKIVTLLKNIQERNSQYDKEQLMDLLRMIQAPEHRLSDRNIAEFVESLNAENIELDIPRLKEILIKFEHSKFYEKHKKYVDHMRSFEHGTDGQSGDAAAIPNSGSSSTSSGEINYHETTIAEPDGIEGSHHGMGHLRGAHIGMGIPHDHPHQQHPHQHSHHQQHPHHHQPHANQPHGNAIAEETASHESQSSEQSDIGDHLPGDHATSFLPSSSSPSSTGIHHHHHHHHHGGSNTDGSNGAGRHTNHHHRHHSSADDQGDVLHIAGVGGQNVGHGGHGHHLVRTHSDGGLVIEAPEENRVHEKLDVNPQDLRPNHAGGTLLTYASHLSTAEKAKSTNDSI